MRIVPSRAQWRSWSLPSKLTAVGCYLGALGVIPGVASLWPSSSAPNAPDLSAQLDITDAELSLRLLLRIQGFRVQVLNEGSVAAHGITVTLRTWQIHAPGPDYEQDVSVRDLPPHDDHTFDVRLTRLIGDPEYDSYRQDRPTSGYFVVRSSNSRRPRAWAFFVPGNDGPGRPPNYAYEDPWACD